MTAAVKLLLSDPDAETIENDGGLWAFSGVRTDALRELLTDAADFGAVRDPLTDLTQDAVVVHVSTTSRRGTIDAFRSVTGTRNLYFLRASDGATVVTDHFRNALSELDVEDRSVPREVVADHLLFRAPIEPRTYVDRVRAVGQGEWVHWSGDAGTWETRLIETLRPAGTTHPADAPRRIDDALTDLLAVGAAPDDLTMFSGGVDSTLLHTYRGESRPFVMRVDSPEFDFESDYAAEALDMLDTPPAHGAVVHEDDFLSHLEASVDRLGFPSHYNQTVVTDATLDGQGGTGFVNGEGADALFGLTGTKGGRFADWLDPLLSPRLAGALDAGLPSRVADSYGTLTTLAERLRRPLAHPESFANQLAFFTDHDAVGDILDESLVADRFQRQSSYVRRRVQLTGSDGFARQVAFGHLLSFFRHNTVDQWRQLGYSRGATFFAPFKTRRMAECALSVPASRRYIQGAGELGSLTTKCHLKSLLGDRLPAYDVTKPKGSGSLPVERYFESGPLSGVFERYPAPSFVPKERHGRHVESFGPVTWNLLTYAVWRDRVLENPDLSPVPGTWRRHVRLASEPTAP